jgi:pyruvate formate-lyase/glycerol dehydratase family glycyl radical enzyme
MTERILTLRNRFFAAVPEICPERARIFTDSMRRTEGQPIVLRRAKAFYEVLDRMSLCVAEGELIVGNQASKPRSAPVYPEYSIEWLRNEFNGRPYHFHERPADRYVYGEETRQEILALLDYWQGKSVYENLRQNLPEEVNSAWDAGVIDDTWVSSSGLGNLLVDFEKVLKNGLRAVIRQAAERKTRLKLSEPGEIQKQWFLDAVILTNRAVINFSNRLARRCREMAGRAQDPQRALELETLAEICARVPEQPARTFWEAVQAAWLILLALHLESNGHAISLGGFDQYLYRYYRADREAGRLTEEQALELIEAFFIKCNELNKLRSWPDTSLFLGYHMAINLAIGGRTAEGRDALNEISRLCIDACADLRLFTPSVSLKVFSGTDERIIGRALKAVQIHQGGQPAFYNDDAFREILRNMGVREEDLHAWAPVGCIEAGVQGKWDYAAKGPWLSVAKVLEITLNGGRDPATGRKFLPQLKELRSFADIGELMEAFKRQLHHFMELQVICEHVNDDLHRQVDLNAFRASLVDDCIERGLTLLEGGSVYSADGGPTCGTVTAGDCLAAIETVVFRKKLLSAEQVAHALETNFEDSSTNPTGEEVRRILWSRAPKFGNDDDGADRWVAEVAEYIGSTYQRDFRNSRFGKGPIPACYAYSQSPVTGNVAFGALVGALPCGRKAGRPVNNGVSPENGAELAGPTAAINSVGKLPSIWFQKGAILNVRLTEDTLGTPEGIRRVAALIRSLFAQKGVQVQFNVVGSETLRDAQRHPESYPDLMVRVSGYSALFTPLDRRAQDDLIERVEFHA